jgi:integrase
MKEPHRAKEGVKPRPPERLARSTKAKIRNIMHVLFNHAVRYDWVKQQANPITRVRQSAKRERIPEVLEIAEFQALLAELTLRDRVLVILDAITGLRRSELAGLKWGDIDFENLEISVTRSVVSQVVGRCKAEASRKPVLLEPSVADDLWLWKQTTPYSRPEDWVFASVVKKGKQPLWLDTWLKKNVQPAAKRAGVKKRVGWHTFRHNYSTLLKANGEDIKTVQELLRHANSKITMDTYTQALSPAKRQAQSKVANLILPKKHAEEKG